MAADREPERRARELRELLIAFHASPGRYNIALRQPAALFSSMRQVLQTAIGRGGLQQGDGGDTALRQAACFFVRSALLHPGASHYELMGLPPSAEAGAIKDRYRLMMRLLHPDFAADEPGLWPADTAARINQAYEVLSSPVRRREYDEQFHAPASPPSVPPPVTPRRDLVRQPERRKRLSLRHTSRGGMKAIMIGCALLGVGLLAAVLIAGHREPEYLVQRSRPAIDAELPGSPAAIVAAPPRQALAVGEPAPAVQRPASAPVAVAALMPATDTASAAAPLPPPAMAKQEPPVQVSMASRPTLDAPQVAGATSSWPAPAVPRETGPVAADPRPAGSGRLSVGRITEAPEPRAADVATMQAAVPAPAPTPARAPVVPGLTLAEAQPLLASLLHGIESGRGEALLNLLEPQARQSATAQALSRQLDGLAGSGGPLRVSAVQFKAEPGDGRLMVTGQMLLDAAPASGAATRRLALRIEFASRAGAVVMTGLSGSAP
jgi:hypothetical protein